MVHVTDPICGVGKILFEGREVEILKQDVKLKRRLQRSFRKHWSAEQYFTKFSDD